MHQKEKERGTGSSRATAESTNTEEWTSMQYQNIAAHWHIFPVMGKLPMVKWRDQSKPQDQWDYWPSEATGYGVDCAKSGLVVIDEDQADAVEGWLGATLPATLTVTTGNGRHLYFSTPAGVEIRNSASKVFPGVDIRGAGGYVVGPGSVHFGKNNQPSGRTYTVQVDVPVVELPGPVVTAIGDAAEQAKQQKAKSQQSKSSQQNANGGLFQLPDVIPEGQRNDLLFRYACSLLERNAGITDFEAVALLYLAYRRCDPLWDGDEHYVPPEEMWQRVRAQYGHDPEEVRQKRVARQAEDTLVKKLAEEQAERERLKRRRAAFEKALANPAGSEEMDAINKRFKPSEADDVRNRTNLPDMIDGVISYQGSLNQINGERGSMKSLISLGLAAAIGSGAKEVYGLPVRVQGRVLYCYLEGAAGLPRRVNAWEAHHGQAMTGVTFTHSALDIRDPDDLRQVALLAKSVGAILIVLDSVQKTGGGKEDGEDFGAYRAGTEALRDATGAAVLAVHNSGYNVNRGRGHTVLTDGMDSCVVVKKVSKAEAGTSGVSDLTDEKSRDSAEVEPLRIRFQPAGPLDPDGKPWSGVVVALSASEKMAQFLAGHSWMIRNIVPVLRKLGEEGIKPKDLAAQLRIDTKELNRRIKDLIAAEVVADNGKQTTARRYLLGPKGLDRLADLLPQTDDAEDIFMDEETAL